MVSTVNFTEGEYLFEAAAVLEEVSQSSIHDSLAALCALIRTNAPQSCKGGVVGESISFCVT